MRSNQNLNSTTFKIFLNDNGTMGAYAEKKINAIARDLKKGRIIESKNVLKIIDSIGDDINNSLTASVFKTLSSS